MTTNTDIIVNHPITMPQANTEATSSDVRPAKATTTPTSVTTTISSEKTGSTCCGCCDSKK
ncbi:hypothetical protein [Undibacterium sp. Ji22W]|uniref:hypothetical protein n=1 Tax=Undibacterium sp. Ji22W TaxID=3413038 RepID=UPI003BEFD0AF